MIAICRISFADDLALSSSSCASGIGLNGQPIVTTQQVAKEIYKAIYKGLFPRSMINDSRVVVSEEETHWVVYQRSHAPIIAQNNNKKEQEKIAVTFGGGVEMEMDKCNAAVKIYYSR
jgi:hypothetical protein